MSVCVHVFELSKLRKQMKTSVSHYRYCRICMLPQKHTFAYIWTLSQLNDPYANLDCLYV